jgi:6-phosphogluconolactonase (cycloisomerase 2 family)
MKTFLDKAARLFAVFAAMVCFATSAVVRADHGKYLYIQTNDIREGKNAVLGYERRDDGSLEPLAGNPFYTGGTGMNNDTHGKLGPNDNDTPVIVTDDGKHLLAVNVHSNTIAVFKINDDGSLHAVKGSPFSSEGIGPNSLTQAGEAVIVSNRNGDYHQLEAIRGAAKASYVSFEFDRMTGELRKASKIEVEGFQKPTQIHIAQTNPSFAFGNDFQVDVDFDGDGKRSFQIGPEPRVQGQLHVFRLGHNARMTESSIVQIPETNADFKYKGSPGVPTTPLGLWTHPKQDLLYVGLVTRNELGVFRFYKSGLLEFIRSVPNSGQDICWALPNKEGTRLYTVNNLPRTEKGDKAATVTTYDISGENAETPVEISRLQLPNPGTSFVNNRNFEQPGSTAFQCGLAPEENYLYVICQRINQTDENTDPEGNYIHTLKLDARGVPSVVATRDLLEDKVDFHSRPQGIATVTRMVAQPRAVAPQSSANSTWTPPTSDKFSEYVDANGEISLPKDFRRNWVNVGNWAAAKKEGESVFEFHDVYVPREVVDLYNQSGQWPDGAPMVKELREATPQKLTTGWTSHEGAIKLWFVMIKDREGRFSGHKDWGLGWGWAQFNADDPAKNVSKNYRVSCVGCHTPRKDTDWIYMEGLPLLKQPK